MFATIFFANPTYLSSNQRANLFFEYKFIKGFLAFSVLFLLGLTFASLSAQTPEYDIVHKVKKGENLFRISKKYETTVERLQALNKLTFSSKIFVNQELLIKKGTAGNSALYRGSGKEVPTFYAWEETSSARNGENSSNHMRKGNTGNGVERGAVSSNYGSNLYSDSKRNYGNSSSRYRDLSYDRQSSIEYTYDYGFDRYNWTDIETNIVGYTDPDILDIIDKLDEQRGSVRYDRYGRRMRAAQQIPISSNHTRMTYRGAHAATNASFRRGMGAIDNPYYKEKVRAQLAGTINYYRVKKGDSLLSIALEQGSSTREIIEENELMDFDLLVGSTLKIVKRD